MSKGLKLVAPVVKELPAREEFDARPLLEGLYTSFESADAARRWLQNAGRALLEDLGVDRVEILAFGDPDGELTVESSWARETRATRLALEDRAVFPWMVAQLAAGAAVVFGDPRDLPDGAQGDREACRSRSVASAATIPLRSNGASVGALVLTSAAPRSWSGRVLAGIEALAQGAAGVLSFLRATRFSSDARLEKARLRERIDTEDVERPKGDARGHGEVVGRGPAILRTLAQVEQVASTSSTVLLLGETGTGKELIARAIHGASAQRHRPMVGVNCGALPTTLIESELFGREKGAYTGALSRQAGRFELADGSTIFLDEVGELAPEIQVKLLRVLEEGELERIGSTTTIKVKVRVIAATNRDLLKMVREGRFREDLYYRLNVFPIHLPPLRDRLEDLPALVWSFADSFGRSMGRQIERIPRSTMETLQGYSWPGNVRELRNVIERSLILHPGPTLCVEIPEIHGVDRPISSTLEDVERRHLMAVLQSTGWRVRGKSGASQILGLKPTTLESRLAKLGIRRPGA